MSDDDIDAPENVEESDETVYVPENIEYVNDFSDFSHFDDNKDQATKAKQEEVMAEGMAEEALRDQLALYTTIKNYITFKDWFAQFSLKNCEQTGFVINEKGEYLLISYELPSHFNIKWVPIPFILWMSFDVVDTDNLFVKQLFRFISKDKLKKLLFASPNEFKEVIDFELRLKYLSFKVIIDQESETIKVERWKLSDLNYFKDHMKHPFIFSKDKIKIQGIRKRINILKNILKERKNHLMMRIRKDDIEIDEQTNVMYEQADKSNAEINALRRTLKSKLDSKHAYLYNRISSDETKLEILNKRLSDMYEYYKIPSSSNSGGGKKTRKIKHRNRKKSTRHRKKTKHY